MAEGRPAATPHGVRLGGRLRRGRTGCPGGAERADRGAGAGVEAQRILTGSRSPASKKARVDGRDSTTSITVQPAEALLFSQTAVTSAAAAEITSTHQAPRLGSVIRRAPASSATEQVSSTQAS